MLTDEEFFDLLKDQKIVFWTCPNGCRGQVEWNNDCTDAKCLVCGAKKSDKAVKPGGE